MLIDLRQALVLSYQDFHMFCSVMASLAGLFVTPPFEGAVDFPWINKPSSVSYFMQHAREELDRMGETIGILFKKGPSQTRMRHICVLNHQRGLTLPRPTAAPTATQPPRICV